MKRCATCGVIKPLEEYHRRRSSADGRQAECKACKQAYNRAYYQANAERHREQRRRDLERMRRDVDALIAEARSSPCMDCGGMFPPEAMDFDHVRGDKRVDIVGMRRLGRDAARTEIAKCEIVCVGCHRQRTRRRRRRMKQTASYGWVPRDSNSQPAA